MARYNANGSLDTTFGTGGKVTTALSSTDDEGSAIALQPDGKIVVAGTIVNGGNNDVALVRYNSNGSLDTSFDGDGKVLSAVSSQNDFARAIVVQPDGKIVVGGLAFGGSGNGDYAVLRYTANGSLDTSFAGTGIVTTAIGTATDDVDAMGLQTDGKIVAAGCSNSGGAVDFAVVRYNSDGGLDCTQCIDTGNFANAHVRAIGADRLWNAPGYLQGQGVTVAVVDSGIAGHGDLGGRVIAAANLTAAPDANDNYVHGTHVAGLIGGSGAASGGGRMGLAPQVNLVNVKVSNEQGVASTSDLIDGPQWLLDNQGAASGGGRRLAGRPGAGGLRVRRRGAGGARGVGGVGGAGLGPGPEGRRGTGGRGEGERGLLRRRGRGRRELEPRLLARVVRGLDNRPGCGLHPAPP